MATWNTGGMSTRRVGIAEIGIYFLMAIGGLVFLAGGLVATGFFHIVPYIVPEAQIERDPGGYFIVTPENYDDLTTYSAVFSRVSGNVGHARMPGDFYVRVLPELVDEAPARIENPANYRSPFYSVRVDGPDVVLVDAADNAAVSEFTRALIDQVRAHNDALVAAGFDARVRFEEPELQISPIKTFGSLDNDERWMRACVDQGCPVSVEVEYSSSLFDGPNVFFVGSGLVVRRSTGAGN